MSDGVVLGVEKLVRSKMLVKGSDKRIFTVAPHAGIVRPSPCSQNLLDAHDHLRH